MNRTGIITSSGDMASAFAATLAWWRDAGVSHMFTDTTQEWLAPPGHDSGPNSGRTTAPVADMPAPDMAANILAPDRRTSAPPAHDTYTSANSSVNFVPDPASWPTELAAFQAWWLGDAALDSGVPATRIPPRGPARAPLMIIIPEPEVEDRDHLLSGPRGRLLDAMLKAMDVAPDDVYRASVSPRHMAVTNWQDPAVNGLGQLLRHHITLVAPHRIIAFGSNISPLFGHDLAQNTASSRILSFEQTAVPSLLVHDLSVLLSRARARAAFWQQWLDWSGLASRPE